MSDEPVIIPDAVKGQNETIKATAFGHIRLDRDNPVSSHGLYHQVDTMFLSTKEQIRYNKAVLKELQILERLESRLFQKAEMQAEREAAREELPNLRENFSEADPLPGMESDEEPIDMRPSSDRYPLGRRPARVLIVYVSNKHAASSCVAQDIDDAIFADMLDSKLIFNPALDVDSSVAQYKMLTVESFKATTDNEVHKFAATSYLSESKDRIATCNDSTKQELLQHSLLSSSDTEGSGASSCQSKRRQVGKPPVFDPGCRKFTTVNEHLTAGDPNMTASACQKQKQLSYTTDSLDELWSLVLKTSDISAEKMAELICKDGILYDNDDIIVIQKPFGLPVKQKDIHSKRVKTLDSCFPILASMLQIPAPELHRIEHQLLDAEATGVFLLARCAAKAAELDKLFQTRRVDKRFWCITVNKPMPTKGQVKAALTVKPFEGGDTKAIVSPRSENISSTDYNVLASGAGSKSSLVECSFTPGYPISEHQIRAHFGLVKLCPVLGDVQYSSVLPKPFQILPPQIRFKLGIRSKYSRLPMFLHLERFKQLLDYNSKNYGKGTVGY